MGRIVQRALVVSTGDLLASQAEERRGQPLTIHSTAGGYLARRGHPFTVHFEASDQEQRTRRG